MSRRGGEAQGRLIILESLNHWVFFAPSHTKFLRQYTKYSLADILVLRERKILQAFCGLESLNLRQRRRRYLRKKSEEDSDEIFEDEARHIRKVVLCVLLEEWRAVLGKVAEDSRILIRRMLGGFSAP